MSLITTAGLWNSNDNDDNTRRTRRISSTNAPPTTNATATTSATPSMTGPSVYPDTNQDMNNIINKINGINIKNAGDKLTKFTPISPPEMQNKKESFTDAPHNTPTNTTNTTNGNHSQKQVSNKNLGDIYSNYNTSYNNKTLNEYYRSPTTTTTEGFHNGGGDFAKGGNLMEKINYAIYLLEAQQAEKTDHVMEEFILYSFVGVFMIFMIDSFNKTTKYTR